MVKRSSRGPSANLVKIAFLSKYPPQGPGLVYTMCAVRATRAAAAFTVGSDPFHDITIAELPFHTGLIIQPVTFQYGSSKAPVP